MLSRKSKLNVADCRVGIWRTMRETEAKSWSLWDDYSWLFRNFKQYRISSLQFSSVPQLCPALWNPMDCSMPGFPVYHQLLELTQTHVHQVSDAIQPSHPLSSLSPPAFSLTQHQGLFKWVSSLHQGPKYWSFRFSISPSNEYSGLIFFKMDWLDLLAVQGTLKSLLQYHSSKASILQCSDFFIVQLSWLIYKFKTKKQK